MVDSEKKVSMIDDGEKDNDTNNTNVRLMNVIMMIFSSISPVEFYTCTYSKTVGKRHDGGEKFVMWRQKSLLQFFVLLLFMSSINHQVIKQFIIMIKLARPLS